MIVTNGNTILSIQWLFEDMNREQAEKVRQKYLEDKKNRIYQKDHANRPHYGVKTLIGNWHEDTRPFYFQPISVQPITQSAYRGESSRTRMETARVNKEKMNRGTSNLFIVGDRRTFTQIDQTSKGSSFGDKKDASTMTDCQKKISQFGHKRFGIQSRNLSSVFAK